MMHFTVNLGKAQAAIMKSNTRMKPEPTAGALRAAYKIGQQTTTPHFLPSDDVVAEIIDRETGLPEILEALGQIEKMPWPNSESPYARIARAALDKWKQQ